MGGASILEDFQKHEGDIESALAAGIFRGEGTIRCVLAGRRPRINPQLNASVEMCDRPSVERVAHEWGSKVSRSSGRCSCGDRAWRTGIGGTSRVRNAFGKWLARGWLTGEKADQYFAAIAKCRRAKEVFLKPPRGKRRRDVF
jgi:hypothetical protein